MEAAAERPLPLSICIILVRMALEMNPHPPGPVIEKTENGEEKEEKAQ